MTEKSKTIELPLLTCSRCGKEFYLAINTKTGAVLPAPIVCPHCRSGLWDKARVNVRRKKTPGPV